MRPSDNIKRLVKKLNDTTNAEMDERVLTDVLKALTETEKISAPTRPKLRRILMKSPITKLTAAAVIVIAVLIGINQLGGKATGVAWGEVVRNMEASPGFTYRLRQTYEREKGTTECDWKVYVSEKYGIRMDTYIDPENTIQMYASLKEETLIAIIHSSKTYSLKPLSDDELAESQNMDPKEIVSQMLSVGYSKLGRKTINGIEAEGVEITNPAVVNIHSETPVEIDSYEAQLWVAVETGLPIYFESKTSINNGVQVSRSIQDEFQWNLELDESEFVPNIPEEYMQTGKSDIQEGGGAHLKKWRFKGKDPQRGYLLESEDGQSSTNIPEDWADSPEHALRIKEELDLLMQQGSGALVGVIEIVANGQLDYRILRYEYTLSNGQKIKNPDFEPDDPSQWTVIGERQEELRQLQEEGKGQELTAEERQVQGRVFIIKKHRYILSDGTEVIRSIGQLKED